MTYPQLSLYIDGEFIHGGGRKEQKVLNPATHEVVGHLPHATTEDLDRALAAAARAFESWKKTSPMERSKVLRRAAELMRDLVHIAWIEADGLCATRQAALRTRES